MSNGIAYSMSQYAEEMIMKKIHRWIFSVATVVVVICGSLTMSLSAETVPTTKPEAMLDASEDPQHVPSIRVVHAYLPAVPKPIDLKIDRPAESLEAVICLLQQPVPNETVSISREHVAAGDPILLLGYPGGVDMLASRVPDDVRHELYAFGQPALDDAAQLLAERGYIAPIAMQTSV